MIGFVIVAFNDARYIEWQLRTINQFCTDDSFEIVIADNSSDAAAAETIRQICQDRAVYLRMLTSDVGLFTGHSHIAALNRSWPEVKHRYEHFAYFDHDLFAVKPFSVMDILGGRKLAGVLQSGDPKFATEDGHPERFRPEARFPWPGFLFFENDPAYRDLVDFHGNHDLGFDSGGNLYVLLEYVGYEQFQPLIACPMKNPYFDVPPYDIYHSFLDGAFVHFINGSGWNAVTADTQTQRIDALLHLLSELSA